MSKDNPVEIFRQLAVEGGHDVDHDLLDRYSEHIDTPTMLTEEHAQRVAEYNRNRPRYVDATMRDGRIVKARLI